MTRPKSALSLAMTALVLAALTGCPSNTPSTTPKPAPTKTMPVKQAPQNPTKPTETTGSKPAGDQPAPSERKGMSAPAPLAVEPFAATPPDQRVTFDNNIVAHLGDQPRVEAEVILVSGQGRPLEYLVVTEAGAGHEALLLLKGTAGDLKQAMELVGLREGTNKLRWRGDTRVPEGAKIRLDLRWNQTSGELVEQPVSDWVWHASTQAPMTRGPWVFSGSLSQFREDLNVDVLQADSAGNVVAIFRDPGCVIDNPRPEGTDEMNWFVNQGAALPRPGLPVTLVIRPYTEE